MEMTHLEMIALYKFLLERDLELDNTLISLFTKIQKQVFSDLSIKDIENLENYYKKLLEGE